MEKERFLKSLIDNYNDSRSKSFYCIASQLILLGKLRKVVGNVETKITGSRGSGTVFFGNCNLRCLYCQNYPISQNWERLGKILNIPSLS